MKRIAMIALPALAVLAFAALAGCSETGSSARSMDAEAMMAEDRADRVEKTEDQWREELTPEQYRVCRQAGTEAPFTGKYYKHKEDGKYLCVACGNELFDSETKYESGSGWPSYWAPISEANVEMHEDRSLGMARTEVTCSRCGAHLGHLFDDGPQPTGMRYCINSAALDFEPREK